MRRMALVLAAALALTGVGCDKDKQEISSQPGWVQPEKAQKPETIQLPAQGAGAPAAPMTDDEIESAIADIKQAISRSSKPV